jgi:DNA repair exonuclease SbcCD nuclease subunit
MRFLHCADIHLDSTLASIARIGGETGDEFVGATRRALANIVDAAIAERVDFVLLAGDLWDGDWSDARTGLQFVREAARLNMAGIPIVGIAGNHDAASVITESLTWPPNVHFLKTALPESFSLKDLNVIIHGQGFPNKAVTANLAVRYPVAEPGAINIGLLHTALEGGSSHAPYAPCSIADLKGKGYQYWALGHVHERRIVDREPYIVYPGNPQGRHVREAGPKGCMLVTVVDREVVACDPIFCDVVRWGAPRIDLTGTDDWNTAMATARTALSEALDAADGRPLAVRAFLTGITTLDARLRARPESLEAELIARAAEVGGDVWIERVVVGTRPPTVASTAGADSLDAVAEIASLIGAADGTEREAVMAALEPLISALPEWAKAVIDDEGGLENALIEGALAQISDRLGSGDAS